MKWELSIAQVQTHEPCWDGLYNFVASFYPACPQGFLLWDFIEALPEEERQLPRPAQFCHRSTIPDISWGILMQCRKYGGDYAAQKLFWKRFWLWSLGLLQPVFAQRYEPETQQKLEMLLDCAHNAGEDWIPLQDWLFAGGPDTEAQGIMLAAFEALAIEYDLSYVSLSCVRRFNNNWLVLLQWLPTGLAKDLAKTSRSYFDYLLNDG